MFHQRVAVGDVEVDGAERVGKDGVGDSHSLTQALMRLPLVLHILRDGVDHLTARETIAHVVALEGVDISLALALDQHPVETLGGGARTVVGELVAGLLAAGTEYQRCNEEQENSLSHHFWRINTLMGVPLKFQRSRILFSRKRR